MYYRSRKTHRDKDGDRQREIESGVRLSGKRDCETYRVFTTHVRHCVLFLHSAKGQCIQTSVY
jgi:hypothetical protein